MNIDFLSFSIKYHFPSLINFQCHSHVVVLYVICFHNNCFDPHRFDTQENDYHRSLLILALGDGLAFTVFVFAFMRLSGGHLNPTITWAAIITRRIGFLKGIAYMLAQIAGGIFGALLIYGATPNKYPKIFNITIICFDSLKLSWSLGISFLGY